MQKEMQTILLIRELTFYNQSIYDEHGKEACVHGICGIRITKRYIE